MIEILLLNAFLAVTASCHDTGCNNGLSLSIEFSGEITASTQISMDSTPIEGTSLARLDIEYGLNHMEKAGIYNESFLIIDNDQILKTQMIIASVTHEATIELDVPLRVMALTWPKGMSKDEVFAFYGITKVLAAK